MLIDAVHVNRTKVQVEVNSYIALNGIHKEWKHSIGVLNIGEINDQGMWQEGWGVDDILIREATESEKEIENAFSVLYNMLEDERKQEAENYRVRR